MNDNNYKKTRMPLLSTKASKNNVNISYMNSAFYEEAEKLVISFPSFHLNTTKKISIFSFFTLMLELKLNIFFSLIFLRNAKSYGMKCGRQITGNKAF